MDSNAIKQRITETSQRKAARVAGFMFLFSFIVPTLNWALVLSKFIVTENVIATAKNIMTNELLFRIGITIELIMSVGLIVLALALYIILKPVNRNLALLGLLWKLAEAVVVAVIVLVSFVALQILIEGAPLAVLTFEQVQAPIGLILNVHTVLYSIPMVFLGLDLMVFFYLFYTSKYIPRKLAGFGIISFALILIHAMGNILVPDYAAILAVEIICYTPSCIAEIVIGIWLLSKDLYIPHQDVHASESAKT